MIMSTKPKNRVENRPFPGAPCADVLMCAVRFALATVAAAIIARSLAASRNWVDGLSDRALRDLGLDRREVECVLASLDLARAKASHHISS
jgi:uncharacterized protein YjiS (DUF1127 family)